MPTQVCRFSFFGTSSLALVSCCFVLALGLLSSASSRAAIIVPASGTAEHTFETTPAASEWSTLVPGPAGAGTTINTVAELDNFVETLAASGIASALPTSFSTPPTSNSAGRMNLTELFLQTHTTGSAISLLMAQLENGGPTVSHLIVDYFLLTFADINELPVEEIPGQRVYYSLSGAINSWIPVGTFDTTSHVTFSLPLGTWASGAPLYLLWADDNAIAGPLEGEIAYTVDNIAFTPVPEPGSIVLGILGLIALVAAGRRCR